MGEHLPCKQEVGGSNPLASRGWLDAHGLYLKSRIEMVVDATGETTVMWNPGVLVDKQERAYGGCLGVGRR